MKVIVNERQGDKFKIVGIGDTVALPRIGETIGIFGEFIEGSTSIREFHRYKIEDICHYLYDEERCGSGISKSSPKEVSLFVIAAD